MRVDGALSNGKLLPFIALSFADDLGNGNRTSLGSPIVNADTHSNLFGAHAGLTALIGERLAIFANAGLTEGIDDDVSGYNAQGGFRLYW